MSRTSSKKTARRAKRTAKRDQRRAGAPPQKPWPVLLAEAATGRLSSFGMTKIRERSADALAADLERLRRPVPRIEVSATEEVTEALARSGQTAVVIELADLHDEGAIREKIEAAGGGDVILVLDRHDEALADDVTPLRGGQGLQPGDGLGCAGAADGQEEQQQGHGHPDEHPGQG